MSCGVSLLKAAIDYVSVPRAFINAKLSNGKLTLLALYWPCTIIRTYLKNILIIIMRHKFGQYDLCTDWEQIKHGIIFTLSISNEFTMQKIKKKSLKTKGVSTKLTT